MNINNKNHSSQLEEDEKETHRKFTLRSYFNVFIVVCA